MRQSLEWLVNRYQRSLFAAVYSLCKNADDANDIVQETFIQYLTSDTDFYDENHIRAWLIRVAINKTKNLFRSGWNRKVLLTDTDQANVAAETNDSYVFDKVMGLPDNYRIVIHLFYYEDMSVREIAEVLGITEGNVKMRLSRGRNMLKKLLEDMP